MKLAPLVLALPILLSAPRTRAAEDDDRSRAKAYFKAGATAYEAGDYRAAIQALDSAYRLTPLPAIAFSLAQAQRREYFVSRERAHLDRAIALYRDYLAQVPTGGRRADATDALAQLEPLALAAASSPAAPVPPEAAEAAKTRLLVTSEAPHASVSLDGGAPVASPLIAEVTPGRHSVKVEARGYFPAERSVVAVSGALVPIEVPLRIRPATVTVAAPPDADLYVDGMLAGKVQKLGRFELAGGEHAFTIAQKGHRLRTVRVVLEPGETRVVRADLVRTSQRTAAYVMFGASAVSLGATVLFGAMAGAEQEKAREIYDRQQSGNVTAEDLEDYDEALDRRGQFRAAAIAGGLVCAGALVTGVFLHEFDHPNVQEMPRLKGHTPGDGLARLRLTHGPGDVGAGLRLAF
ncbi:MAG TPA: PEGA domain-containing protein [Polyangiaceae bacterium]